MFRAASIFVMFAPVPALAQPIPTQAAPIVGPATAVTGRTATYEACWRGAEGVPYVWKWQISGSARLIEEPDAPDRRCFRAKLRFATTAGNARVDYAASSNGRPWPSPPTRNVPVRWPTLNDTSGPYRITARVTRNGRVVGPSTSRTVSERNVTRLTGGVTRTAPRNIRVVCAYILDVPTNTYPRSGNAKIRRCKRV